VSQITDKDFMKTLVAIIGGLFAFMVIIIIAANFLTDSESEVKTVDPMVANAIKKRIQPVGAVTTGTVAAAPATGPADGKSVYESSCAACHGTGAAGSPKLGDKNAWVKRIAQGNNTLFSHAINGFKGMPPRGGSSQDDDAVKAAVKYMVKNSQ
jgi:cytochrome c5